MLIKQTPDETLRSITIQRRCELLDICLLSSEAQREMDLNSLVEPVTVNLAFKGLGALVDDGLRVIVDLSAVAQDSSPTKRLAFQLACKFRVQYELKGNDPPPNEEEIASFSNANAVFNCWPYAREFFQSTASRMSVHLPALPYLRIVTVKEQPPITETAPEPTPSEKKPKRTRRTSAS